MSWLSESEFNFGMVLKGKISPTRYNSKMFFPPYDRGFELFPQGKAAIIKEIGLTHYQTALRAVEQLNGEGDDSEIDWASGLEKSALSWELGDEFDRITKKLRESQEPDFSKIDKLRRRFEQGLSSHFVTLDDMWDKELEPDWIESGFAALDYWLGGIPRYGLWSIGGEPKGAGKTSAIMGSSIAFVKKHIEKTVSIFTLEMFAEQFTKRLKQLELAGKITKEERERIYICDERVDEDQCISWASALPNLGLMFVDFADLMIKGEVTESKMTALVTTLANGSKELKTSIGLISQMSGKYEGGLPRPYHLRYSRLIEALAVVNLMLWVPWRSAYEIPDPSPLEIYQDSGYIIKWFSRFETAINRGIPTAISVKLDKAGGWDMSDKGEGFLIENKAPKKKKYSS